MKLDAFQLLMPKMSRIDASCLILETLVKKESKGEEKVETAIQTHN